VGGCGECQRFYGCNHPRLPKEIPNFRRHIQKFIEPFPITSIRLRITQVARSLTWQITCCAGWQVPQEAERLRSPRPRAAWQAVRAARPNPARRDQRRWRRAGTAAPSRLIARRRQAGAGCASLSAQRKKKARRRAAPAKEKGVLGMPMMSMKTDALPPVSGMVPSSTRTV